MNKGSPKARAHFTIRAKGWETRWWNQIGYIIAVNQLDREIMPILEVCQTSSKHESALKCLLLKAYEQGMIRGAQAQKRWEKI